VGSDIGGCSRIKNVSGRDFCYGVFATKRKDPIVCDRVNDSRRRDDCYTKIAIENEVPLLCNDVADFDGRQYCFGVVMFDERACDKIINKEKKENCTAAIT
jgi:hypothetical protein